MGVEITSIRVNAGTSVTVFMAFTKPTRATYPKVVNVAATPTTVTVEWRWTGGSTTTWTYGTGTHITKLSTGVYVFTIATSSPSSPMITGLVTGAGVVTATAEFSVTVGAVSA